MTCIEHRKSSLGSAFISNSKYLRRVDLDGRANQISGVSSGEFGLEDGGGGETENPVQSQLVELRRGLLEDRSYGRSHTNLTDGKHEDQ